MLLLSPSFFFLFFYSTPIGRVWYKSGGTDGVRAILSVSFEMTGHLRSLLKFCLVCVCLFEFIAANAPLVKVKNGTLSGLFMRTRKGREFAGFRGIPYALPPVRELRFEVSCYISKGETFRQIFSRWSWILFESLVSEFSSTIITVFQLEEPRIVENRAIHFSILCFTFETRIHKLVMNLKRFSRYVQPHVPSNYIKDFLIPRYFPW